MRYLPAHFCTRRLEMDNLLLALRSPNDTAQADSPFDAAVAPLQRMPPGGPEAEAHARELIEPQTFFGGRARASPVVSSGATPAEQAWLLSLVAVHSGAAAPADRARWAVLFQTMAMACPAGMSHLWEEENGSMKYSVLSIAMRAGATGAVGACLDRWQPQSENDAAAALMLWTRYVIHSVDCPNDATLLLAQKVAASDHVTCVWEARPLCFMSKLINKEWVASKSVVTLCDAIALLARAAARSPAATPELLYKIGSIHNDGTAAHSVVGRLLFAASTRNTTKHETDAICRAVTAVVETTGLHVMKRWFLLSGDAVARVLAAALRACKVHMCDDTVLHTYGFVEWQRTRVCAWMRKEHPPTTKERRDRDTAHYFAEKMLGFALACFLSSGLPHSATAVSAVLGAVLDTAPGSLREARTILHENPYENAAKTIQDNVFSGNISSAVAMAIVLFERPQLLETWMFAVLRKEDQRIRVMLPYHMHCTSELPAPANGVVDITPTLDRQFREVTVTRTNATFDESVNVAIPLAVTPQTMVAWWRQMFAADYRVAVLTLARCKRSAWYHAGAAHRAGWTPGCHRRNLARGIYTAKQHAVVKTVVMVSGTQRVSRLPFLPQELWHAIIGAAFALRAA